MDQEAKKENNAVHRKKFWMQWIPLVKGERRYNYTDAWDPFMVRFTEKLVPFKVAEKAMEALYVNCTMEMGDDGLTPLEDMKAQFHFITEERHIEKLRKMKREGIKCCREHMKFFIGLEMEIETEKRIAKGEALNMKQYLEMFKRIRTDHEIPDYIKASRKWVEQWKKEMEEESKKDGNEKEQKESEKSDEQPEEEEVAGTSESAAGSSGLTGISEEFVDVKEK